MDSSENIGLPYIMAQQAQKFTTHNEGLNRLDAIVQLSVLSRSLASPPGSPAPGARYLVAAGASGAWTGREDDVAAFFDGDWMFHAPRTGWRAFVEDEGLLALWDGAAWRGALSGAELMGVNTAADTTNRLAVASPASLFTHDGADHRLNVNKAAAGNTASLVFETGYSGRAELGLAGDDNLHLKVSPNGASWIEALSIDRTTGAVLAPVGLRFPGYWRYYNSSGLLTTGTADVVLNTASHNPGGAYNTANGVFTAPSAGIYLMNINHNTNGASQCVFDVLVNGVAATRVEIHVTGYTHSSKTFLLLLAAGDQVKLRNDGGGGVRFDGGGLFDNVAILRLGVS